jgi:hypothetical protein
MSHNFDASLLRSAYADGITRLISDYTFASKAAGCP